MSNYFHKEKEICNLANSGKSFVKGFKQELVGFSGKKLFNTLVGLTQNQILSIDCFSLNTLVKELYYLKMMIAIAL